MSDQEPTQQSDAVVSAQHRRQFLAGVGSVSVATLVAGCRDPRELEIDKTTATPRDVAPSNPDRKELLLAPVVPTVALKTGTGDWIPRSVITGVEPGWELALQTGTVYDSATDRGSEGEGIDPPDWVPDSYVDSNIDDFRFFKLPSQLLVSGSPSLEPVDYPSGLSLESTDLTFKRSQFDPTDRDSLSFETVVAASGGGQNESDHIAPTDFYVSVGESNRFRESVGDHPDWDDSSERLRARAEANYGATDTTAERLGNVLEFGFQELLELYVTTALTFTTGGSVIRNGLFPTLANELENRVYDLAFGGSPEAAAAVAVFDRVATEGGWERPEDVDNLGKARAIDGSLFLPPLTDGMADALDIGLGGRTPEYDVEITDAGIGLSGPMAYFVDLPDGSGSSQETVYDVSLEPTSTFLRVTEDDSHTDPAIVPLGDIGASPGDRIRLEVLGDYQRGGIEGDRQNDTIAVFSETDRFLGQCQVVDGDLDCSGRDDPRLRVPGAIDAGPDVRTRPTYRSEKPTDIQQDFDIDGTVTVTVPDGARYLFIGAEDNFYEDNVDEDGDYAVRIYPPEE